MKPSKQPLASETLAEDRRLWRNRMLAGVGVIGVLIAVHPPLTSSALLSPFLFQEPGQAPLLLVRLGVLFVSLHALRREWRAALLVVVLFLFSLAVKGALYPFVLVAAGFIAFKPMADRSGMAVLYGTLGAALALIALSFVRTPEAPPDERDPAKMVAYWRDRQNPYKARWWAVVWAKQEAESPGQGLLALARLDWELGRQAQARKMLVRLLAHPLPDALRAEAEADSAKWGPEGAEP